MIMKQITMLSCVQFVIFNNIKVITYNKYYTSLSSLK